MEANELRIGNVVYVKDVIDIITRVGDNDLCSNIYGHGLSNEDIKPVPITEEWLLKFGFINLGSMNVNEYEKYTSVYCLGEDNICKVKFTECCYGNIEEKYITFSWAGDQSRSIRFVHELQNGYHWHTEGKELTYIL